MPEIGGDQDRGPVLRGRQRAVGLADQGDLRLGQVGDQHRLIDLYPLRARIRQLGQQVEVQRHQLGQTLERGTAGGLGQLQEGDRTDHHRTCGDAELDRLVEFGQQLAGMQ